MWEASLLIQFFLSMAQKPESWGTKIIFSFVSITAWLWRVSQCSLMNNITDNSDGTVVHVRQMSTWIFESGIKCLLICSVWNDYYYWVNVYSWLFKPKYSRVESITTSEPTHKEVLKMLRFPWQLDNSIWRGRSYNTVKKLQKQLINCSHAKLVFVNILYNPFE